MIGGFSEQTVEDHHRNTINGLKASIESQLGASHTSYHVDRVFTQVVAGTYLHFHLTADNGSQLSVLVFEPLPHTQQPATVERVEQGHTEARNPN
jgi:hypothetical protein